MVSRENSKFAEKTALARLADMFEAFLQAFPELVAKIENGKYVLHQPFNRQIKKMKQDGLPMAPATIDDWHQATCELLEP